MSGFAAVFPNITGTTGRIKKTLSGRSSVGVLNISFDAPDLQALLDMLARVKAKTNDMFPVMYDISKELAEIVDRHFDRQQGPYGKWSPRSPMTHLMAQRSRGLKIHTGPLLNATGKLKGSFKPKAYTKKASIGSRLKTKSGENLGAIQHFGSLIRVTPKMQKWFKANFWLNLEVGFLIIPSREMLYMTQSDRKKMLNMVQEYIMEGFER